MGVERQLVAELDKARVSSGHAVTIGTKAENAVRKALHAHLPTGLRVGHGIVHDSFGNVSKQTDLVISNPDHPFNFPDDEPGEFLLEGVSAVGEVKAVLGGKELDDCIAAGSQFKSLCPRYNNNDELMNPSDYMLDTNGLPPFIVIAFESRISRDTLWQRLTDAPLVEPHPFYAAAGMKPQPPVDAVCVLGKHALWNLRQVDGPIRLKAGDEIVRGWVAQDTTAPLSWTLGWLHIAMPRILRREPIFKWYFIGQQIVGAEMIVPNPSPE